MLCKRRMKSTPYQAVFLLLCFLKPSTQSSVLDKDGGEGQKDTDTAAQSFTKGFILFGSERVVALKSNVTDTTTKKPSNNSAGVEVAYQADYAGWSKGHDDDADSAEVEWRRMAPSLQCGGDRMKFRAMGPRASQFQLDQGHAPPLPLSQVPQSCGYSMQKNPLGLVMVVPYNGCNMMQQSEGHVLPLLWQGTPVSLFCPQPSSAPLPAESGQSARKPPSQIKHHSQKPAVGWGQYPYFPDPYAPEPTTTTTKPPAPKVPQYPFYYPPFMHYPFYPPSTKAPTTTKPPTTTTTAAKQQPPHPFYPYPFFPPFFFPPFSHYPPPMPQSTTAKPTTTAAPTKPQPPAYPPFLPIYPPFPPFFPYPVAPPATTTTAPKTTTKAVTTTKAQPAVPPHFHPHMHPHFHLPFPPFFPYPFPPPTAATTTTTTTTTAPKTTTKSTTTTKAQPPVPPHFHPHMHPHFHLPALVFPPYQG